MAVQKAESEEMYVLQMVQINENNKSDHELKSKLMLMMKKMFRLKSPKTLKIYRKYKLVVKYMV